MKRAIAVAAVWACLGCQAVVLSGLDEAQAGEAAAALDAVRIAARVSREPGAGAAPGEGAFRVEVPEPELARALAVLHAAGLPRREPSGLDALDESTGLVATPEEERGRLMAALSGELSRSLARLPGVREARVHVSLGARHALDQPAEPPKAGVLLLRAAGAAKLPEAEVRALVAAGVPGLEPGAVSVVQSEARAARAPQPALVSVGPISVSRDSAPALRAMLAAALLLLIALASALIAAVARRRAAR